MKQFDKLPYDIQVMVELEASMLKPTLAKMHRILNFNSSKGNEIGHEAIKQWRKNPLYQAALQEKYAEMQEKLGSGWMNAFESGMFTLAENLLENAIERVLRGGSMMDLDKQVKSISVLVKDLEKIEILKGKGEGSKTGLLEQRLAERMKNSPTGQEYLRKKKENREDEERN